MTRVEMKTDLSEGLGHCFRSDDRHASVKRPDNCGGATGGSR